MRVDDARMDESQTTEKFVSSRQAAMRLGLPIVWLKREARAGRIPCLRLGNRMRFHVEAVERSLLERVNRQEESIA